jgi:hypothetical protein
MRSRIALSVLVTAVAAPPAAANAAPVTRAEAIHAAKRAASREATSMGLALPPSAWTAVC